MGTHHPGFFYAATHTGFDSTGIAKGSSELSARGEDEGWALHMALKQEQIQNSGSCASFLVTLANALVFYIQKPHAQTNPEKYCLASYPR